MGETRREDSRLFGLLTWAWPGFLHPGAESRKLIYNFSHKESVYWPLLLLGSPAQSCQ